MQELGVGMVTKIDSGPKFPLREWKSKQHHTQLLVEKSL